MYVLLSVWLVVTPVNVVTQYTLSDHGFHNFSHCIRSEDEQQWKRGSFNIVLKILTATCKTQA